LRACVSGVRISMFVLIIQVNMFHMSMFWNAIDGCVF